MKAFISILATLGLCLLTSHAYALDDNHNYTLTLTVINHTNETLTFAGVKQTNPGNIFQVTPTEILPGGAATVTGTTTPYYDLTGHLRFRDSTGFVSLLRIQNHRHINYQQPKFLLHNENYIAYTHSRKYNEDTNARTLTSSAATVVIENKLS
jgi:hypothetical protein